MKKTRGLKIGASLGLALAAAGCAYDTSEWPADEQTSSVDDSIVKGVVAGKRAWPSLVQLAITYNDGTKQLNGCGATIIHPKKLLTAAHCVLKSGTTVKTIEVTPGVDNLFDENVEFFPVNHIIRFPLGIDTSTTPVPSPDIAIIELTDAVPAPWQRNQRTDEVVSPALLPTVQVQNPTVLAGWGEQKDVNADPAQLMQVTVPFLGVGSACNSLTGWDTVRANEFCAGFTDVFKGACFGDSGGPDYLRINGAWKELGVMSWTTAACGTGVQNQPTVSALLPSAYDWIMTNLPASEGRVNFTKTSEVSGAVVQSEFAQVGRNSKWDVMVPGTFSTLTSSQQGMLTYSRSRGEVQIYKINASQSLTLVKTTTALPKTWTHLIPGQFDGAGQTDFFAYDAGAQTGAFYIVDASGNLTLRNTVTDKAKLLKVWRVMVPGKFNSDGLTDLFFYDPTSGAARVYTTDTLGNLNEATVRTFAKNWEIVVPGEFNRDTTFTDLLFYNPSDGHLKVTGTATVSGVLNPAATTLIDDTTSFGKNWQYLVPGNFAGTSLTDIAAYNPLQGPTPLADGTADPTHGTLRYFKTVEPVSGTGALTSITMATASSVAWAKVYTQLMGYTRNGLSTRTDIMGYERFSRSTVRAKGDMNGDGRSDIVVTGGPGWTSVPWGMSTGDGTFTPQNFDIANGSSFPGWATVAGVKAIAGDFNGDGLNDVGLLGAPNWKDIAIAFADGAGNYEVTDLNFPGSFGLWAGETNVRSIAGDYDGDGKTDVALLGGATWLDVPVAFSNGNGSFRVVDIDSPSFAKWARDPAVKSVSGDFDADGKDDIAILGGPNWKDVAIAFSNGDGSFRITDLNFTGNFGLWAGAAGVKVVGGDFDGDGRGDIALTGAAGWDDLPVAFSKGDGTFEVLDPKPPNFPGWAALKNVRVVSGDYDGDGRSDLALLGGVNWNDVAIAYSTGRGTFRQTDLVSADLAAWAARATNKILSQY
jgi:secreted trypsin-like serine protease